MSSVTSIKMNLTHNLLSIRIPEIRFTLQQSIMSVK